MNPPNERGRGKLIEGKATSSQESDELKSKIQDMQMEIDIMKETIDVLKPRHQQDSVKQRGKGSDCLCLKNKISTTAIAEKAYNGQKQLLLSKEALMLCRKTQR